MGVRTVEMVRRECELLPSAVAPPFSRHGTLCYAAGCVAVCLCVFVCVLLEGSDAKIVCARAYVCVRCVSGKRVSECSDEPSEETVSLSHVRRTRCDLCIVFFMCVFDLTTLQRKQ